MKKAIIYAIIGAFVMAGSPAIAGDGWHYIRQMREAQQYEYEMQRQQWIAEEQHRQEIEMQRQACENERIRMENKARREREYWDNDYPESRGTRNKYKIQRGMGRLSW